MFIISVGQQTVPYTEGFMLTKLFRRSIKAVTMLPLCVLYSE